MYNKQQKLEIRNNKIEKRYEKYLIWYKKQENKRIMKNK